VIRSTGEAYTHSHRRHNGKGISFQAPPAPKKQKACRIATITTFQSQGIALMSPRWRQGCPAKTFNVLFEAEVIRHLFWQTRETVEGTSLE
jgi:hypothetical protein